ncbi:MAG: outer membrane protein assembly factor BamE [Gammaproteobacteria bacterium]
MADENVNQLHKGMTQEQVRFLLGSPALEQFFDKEQWNYIYTYQKGNSFKRTTKRLTLTFEKGLLIKIDKAPMVSSF